MSSDTQCIESLNEIKKTQNPPVIHHLRPWSSDDVIKQAESHMSGPSQIHAPNLKDRESHENKWHHVQSSLDIYLGWIMERF